MTASGAFGIKSPLSTGSEGRMSQPARFSEDPPRFEVNCMDRRDFSKIMGAAVAGMLAGSKVAFAEHHEKGGKHVCKGMNECKGKGGCKTDNNECAGKNECKGKGGCATAAKHDCKGHNECKGQGGCKSGDNGCAGKNSCKGKGGCAVPIKK